MSKKDKKIKKLKKKLKESRKIIELRKKMCILYTPKQFISFGNYLLSKDRDENIKHEKDKVWNEDIENWKEKEKSNVVGIKESPLVSGKWKS